MNPLIIDRPSLQSSKQRMIFQVITFLFWLLWLYIWLPLISLIAWGFGVQLFYDEMILENGLQAIIELSGTYGVIIGVLGTSLISWAMYNWRRFRNRERRSETDVLSNEELANYFQVDANELKEWHRANRLVVHHDKQGNIEQVVIGYPENSPNKE